jgi:hypothetical protein
MIRYFLVLQLLGCGSSDLPLLHPSVGAPCDTGDSGFPPCPDDLVCIPEGHPTLSGSCASPCELDDDCRVRDSRQHDCETVAEVSFCSIYVLK